MPLSGAASAPRRRRPGSGTRSGTASMSTARGSAIGLASRSCAALARIPRASFTNRRQDATVGNHIDGQMSATVLPGTNHIDGKNSASGFPGVCTQSSRPPGIQRIEGASSSGISRSGSRIGATTTTSRRGSAAAAAERRRCPSCRQCPGPGCCRWPHDTRMLTDKNCGHM